MNQYLLDTHTFLWWVTDNKRLSQKTRGIIVDPKNRVLISVVTAWELSLKKDIIPGATTTASLQDLFERGGFTILPITLEHVITMGSLPLIHKDPFDRMLIAQTMVEQAVLITKDTKITQYPGLQVLF